MKKAVAGADTAARPRPSGSHRNGMSVEGIFTVLLSETKFIALRPRSPRSSLAPSTHAAGTNLHHNGGR